MIVDSCLAAPIILADAGVQLQPIAMAPVRAAAAATTQTAAVGITPKELTDQFDNHRLRCRTPIERENFDDKLADHDKNVKRDSQTQLPLPGYVATQLFGQPYKDLIKEAESLLIQEAKNISGGAGFTDYVAQLAAWQEKVKVANERFSTMLQQNNPPISLQLSAQQTPLDQLQSIINFFKTDKAKQFQNYDVDGIKIPEAFAGYIQSSQRPMSTLMDQAEYLQELVRGLDKRLEIVNYPKEYSFKRQPPVALNSLENKIDNLDALRKKYEEANNTLVAWQKAFFTLPADDAFTKSLSALIIKQYENLTTLLSEIKTQTGCPNLNIDDIQNDKGFLLLKATVMQVINAYIETNGSVRGKGYGVEVANRHLAEIIGTNSSDQLIPILLEHFSREEPRATFAGVGFFGKKPGNLDANSLDTHLLNAIKGNPTAFSELQKKVPEIANNQPNQAMRDAIIAANNLSQSAAPKNSQEQKNN